MSASEYIVIGHVGGELLEGFNAMPVVLHQETNSVCVFSANAAERKWYPRASLGVEFAKSWVSIDPIQLPVACMRDNVQCYVIQVYGAMCVQMANGRIVTTPPLKLWRIREVSCDGGDIGKTWREIFFTDKSKAEERLAAMVSEKNTREEARGRDFAMYREGKVNGIVGWISLQYGMAITLDSVEVAS